MAYDLDAATQYIIDAAKKRGIDPQVALSVARSEGLQRGTWQSRVKKNGMAEPSYGPWQFLVGDGKNFPKGMGNQFMNETGLDPTDPANVNAMTDFALDQAAKDGWRQWYGAKNSGIDRWAGLKGSQPKGMTINSTPYVDPRLPMIDGPGDNTWNDMAHANMDQKRVAAPVDVAQAPVSTEVSPASTSSQTFGDKLGASLFGPELAGKLKTMSAPAVPGTTTTPAAPGGVLTQGLGLLSGIMAPKQAPVQSAPIQSTLPAASAEDAERAKGAASMMAALMAAKQPDKRKTFGTSINSVPGMF